jgi:hypothetical protein
MDGHSILPLLMAATDANGNNDNDNDKEQRAGPLPASVASHLESLGDPEDYAAKWRTAAFIEYYYVADNDKCMQNCTYPTAPWPTAVRETPFLRAILRSERSFYQDRLGTSTRKR